MSESVSESSVHGVLAVSNLRIHHGQLLAVDDVSFTLGASEVLAIIGANGAGKSTLLRTIAGLHTQTSGTITYDGEEISKLRTFRRVILPLLRNRQVGLHLTSWGDPFASRHYRSILEALRHEDFDGVRLFLLTNGPSLLLWGAVLFFPARLVWKKVRRSFAS